VSEVKENDDEERKSVGLRNPSARVGAPSRVVGGDDFFETAGFAFHRDEVFVRPRVLALFESLHSHPSVVRCKGAVRVGKEWVAPAFEGEERVALEPVAYRRDSRIEVIVKRNASADVSSVADDAPAPTDAPNEAGPVWDESDASVRSAGRAAATRDWDALERAIKAAVKPPRAG
jgi:hypothetical protein